MYKFRVILTVIIFSQVLLGMAERPVDTRIAPKNTTVYHKLGDRTVPIKISRFGEAEDLVMINLHGDEFTSVTAAKKFLEKEGGVLIMIENNQKRNISFRLRGRTFVFDPNRIFSREGISKALTELGRSSKEAIDEVDRFASRILQLIPANPSCVIALHNNTDGNFSVLSYTRGNPRAADAKHVSVNPSEDPDDLFLTTDRFLYEQLAQKNYNVILQNNTGANKDGSLSVYCGEKGIRYLNCETEHGKPGKYLEMIQVVATILDRSSEAVSFYHFQIENGKQLPPVSSAPIYFGEKLIGRIRYISINEQTGSYTGRLEIDSNFPVYRNMDFFVTPTPEKPRFELTIDPTRPKERFDSLEDSIEIKVKS